MCWACEELREDDRERKFRRQCEAMIASSSTEIRSDEEQAHG